MAESRLDEHFEDQVVCVYPYTHDWKPIVHFSEFLFPGQRLVASVRPLEGNMEQYAQKIIPYPSDSFSQVLLTEGISREGWPATVRRFLLQSMEVDNCCPVPGDLFAEAGKIGASGKLRDYTIQGKWRDTCEPGKLYEIPVPVIFVLSLYEDLDKFALQIALRKILCEESVSVSQIGTRQYCERFGFHSFPAFMFENELTAEEKVLAFNHYVYQMVVEENTDAIIIGIPGAYTKLNLSYPMKFGILPYLVSQAIVPDYAVMCTFYAEFPDDTFWKTISQSCSYKLGFHIDIFHMSGSYIDLQPTKALGKIKYTHVPDAVVDRMVQSRFADSFHTVFNGYSLIGEETLRASLLKNLATSYEEVGVKW